MVRGLSLLRTSVAFLRIACTCTAPEPALGPPSFDISPTPYRGLDHFGLAVTGIDAIAADLKAKGVEFTREPTTIRPGVRVCFIRGPEGVSIELLDRNVN